MPGAALPVLPQRNLLEPTMATTPATPGAAREFSVGRAITLTGPHGGGGVTVEASQSHPACTKNVYFRLYRDGVLISTEMRTMSNDLTHGADQTLVLSIPPEYGSRSATYRVTWAADCNSSLYSASRRVYIAPVPKGWRRMVDYPDLGPGMPLPRDPAVPLALPSLSRAPGGGLRQQFRTTNVTLSGVAWALPLRGSLTVTGLVRQGSAGSNFDIRGGLLLFAAGGRGHVFGPFRFEQQLSTIGITTVSLTANASGYDGYLQNGGTQRAIFDRSTLTWMRCRWDAVALSFAFEWSGDRRTWTTIHTRTGMASADQPTHVGMGQYVNSGNNANVTTAIDLLALEVVPGAAA